MPCSRCGAANGVTAIACWQCDLQLMPEPQPVLRPASPPPVLEDDVPVVESEVPPAMLEQIRARAAAAADHDGPRTLPPFAPPHDTLTANDPLFASAPASTMRPSRLMLAVAGLTLASVLAGSLLWRSDDARTDAPAAVAVPAAAETAPVLRAEPRPAPVVAVAPAAAVAPPAAAAPPVVVAKVAPPPMVEALPKPVQPPKRITPRPPPRQVAAVREEVQPASPPQAVRPPPPVQGACTPQIAALALCTLESR